MLREEERRALAGLTPTERVRLALALGERDLETFRALAEAEDRLAALPEEACRLWRRIRRGG